MVNTFLDGLTAFWLFCYFQLKCQGHSPSPDLVLRCSRLSQASWLPSRDPLLPTPPGPEHSERDWNERARAALCVRAIQEPAAMNRSTDWSGPYPRPEPSDRSSALLRHDGAQLNPAVTCIRRRRQTQKRLWKFSEVLNFDIKTCHLHDKYGKIDNVATLGCTRSYRAS